MRFAKVGYYSQRQKARVPVDKRRIEGSFKRRPERLRVEAIEEAIILTDPRDESWRKRHD